MRRFARIAAVPRIAAVLGFAAGLLLLPATAASAPHGVPGIRADVDDFEFESFDAVYELSRTGDGHAALRVTETIVAVYPDFDQNRGFYRDIPEYYGGVRLHTDVESVVDENGDPVPWEWEYYQGYYSVALGDDSYVHGRHSYVISYTQVDTIRSFTDVQLDEFYRDVNGTGWGQPFAAVTATVLLPPELAAARSGELSCYVAAGPCPDGITQTPTADGGLEVTTSASDLSPGESLTLDIPFAAGTFVEGESVSLPEYPVSEPQPNSPGWVAVLPWALGGAGILLGVVARVTQSESSTGRRIRPHGTVIPQYEPPAGLNVMVAAMLLGEPNRAFAAQVVDLAVRGNLRIVEPEGDDAGPFTLELLSRDGVDPVEGRLLDELFDDNPPGARFGVKRGSDSLQAVATPVFRRVDAEVRSGGFRADARVTTLSVVLIVLAVVGILVGLGMLGASYAGDTGFGVLEAGILGVGGPVWGLRQAVGYRSTSTPLTRKGRDVGDHLFGIRMYLQWAEADRIRFLQSPERAERVDVGNATEMVKLYERLLPYAILFGIEDGWAAELQAKYAAAHVPVRWVSGGGLDTWRVSSTVDHVRRFSPRPPRPVVSRAAGGYATKRSKGWSDWFGGSSGRSGSGWSSSGGSSFSSGSSGGGFSGGGGGGGGGRGR